ncbi:nucleotide exchange factor GrpE [Selenomonas ruminis]|uniref:Protein GrpE n=1 Tax=Selenomonas ruminis TaxID=2593411 RepID=A0A5D6W4P9_9FIRM|nr:nucleotide exchange factor GrpE [Selenomonas sp. mPRGC5]TYZ23411.1 nucleotide exchange factor GrpE [Selenomonas sp. mPRGC5]
MKDELKKKDEQKLDEMQQEINEASAEAEAEEAEGQEDAEADEAPETEASDEAQQLEKLTADLKEKEERVLRLQADFENFRRRTAKEKEELSAVVTQGILKDMLPLLDNFERAMAAEAKDGEAFQKGVEMIFTQFGEVLKKNGLEKIETEGQKFDPNFHQAVMRVQNEELEDDDIAQELQKGYMVKGRVIRPSMVQVVAN